MLPLERMQTRPRQRGSARSAVLEQRVPANLRHPDGLWFGFSTRARLIFYNKQEIEPGAVKTYEDLADPRWRGRVCIRSSGNSD